MIGRWIAIFAFVTLWSPTVQMQSATAGPDVRGGWQAEQYLLKTGERHPLKGSIVFTATDWSVTYFVTPEGEAQSTMSSSRWRSRAAIR